jgi:hypothetical protein
MFMKYSSHKGRIYGSVIVPNDITLGEIAQIGYHLLERIKNQESISSPV